MAALIPLAVRVFAIPPQSESVAYIKQKLYYVQGIVIYSIEKSFKTKPLIITNSTLLTFIVTLFTVNKSAVII